MIKVNWAAVLVSALIGMAVPFVWYLKGLFGAEWQRLAGLTDEDLKGNGAALGLAAACSLVTAYALAGFMTYFGSRTFGQGAAAGAQLWLGFVATALLTDHRFSKRPWKLAFINTGHWLVSLVLMGGVLAVWQ